MFVIRTEIEFESNDASAKVLNDSPNLKFGHRKPRASLFRKELKLRLESQGVNCTYK
jgi:hypothetical protein